MSSTPTAFYTPTIDYSRPPFFVPSESRRNVKYMVATGTDGFLHCDCPARQGRKSRGHCWHVKAVASGAIKPAAWKRPTALAGRAPLVADPSRPVRVDDLYA